MAVRERGLAGRVGIWGRREASRRACLERGLCDEAPATVEAALAGSDGVILCLPVDGIVRFLQERGKALPEGMLVTDVGSTKERICRVAREELSGGACFVGSHPMAGSEKSGLEHARGDLFAGRCCLVTPTEEVEAMQGVLRVRSFWEALGMTVQELSPAEHDRAVGHISHLPHLLASALAAFLAEQPKEWSGFAGGGLRDTTRVAAGGVDLWASIFEQNRGEVLAALEGWEATAAELKMYLKTKDEKKLRALLEKGRLYREGLE